MQSEAVTGLRVREESLKTRLQDEVASHTELQHKYACTRVAKKLHVLQLAGCEMD